MNHKPAVLVRDIPVRVLDVSLSGLRLAIDQPLDEAVVGRLGITLDGNDYQDTVQIVRCVEHPGTRLARTVGGRFAWATSPGSASIRGAVPVESGSSTSACTPHS